MRKKLVNNDHICQTTLTSFRGAFEALLSFTGIVIQIACNIVENVFWEDKMPKPRACIITSHLIFSILHQFLHGPLTWWTSALFLSVVVWDIFILQKSSRIINDRLFLKAIWCFNLLDDRYQPLVFRSTNWIRSQYRFSIIGQLK